MEIEWQESFDTIKIKHDEAYKTIEVARKHDEASNAELALLNYKLSMEIIDEALLTPVALPDETDDLDETWHLALEMIQKMKRTRAELIRRIGILSPSTSNQNNFVDKNGDSNTEHVVKERPRTFLELAEALQNFEYDFNSDELPTVLELLFLCEGVKLYHINVHGEVTTADELSTLRIIRLDQDLTQKLEATYFMQIIRSSATTTIQIDESLNGIDNNIENDISCTSLPKQTNEKADISIIYPLVPGVSPCFRTDYGAFIFPDIESDVAGAAFGLVIPSGTDQIVLEILEAILHGVVRQSVPEEVEKEEEEEEEEGEFTRKRARRAVSEKISENLVHGACFISNGLVKGSEQVGKFVSFTTPYIISKLNKAPENSPPVSNKVIGSVEMAKSATSMAVNVTGYVAGKVGVATMALGRFLAPHVHAQGSKLLSSAMGISSDEATNKVKSIRFKMKFCFSSFR